jgi:hypothetical protein
LFAHIEKREKNSLQANEIMQHQPRFNNNEPQGVRLMKITVSEVVIEIVKVKYEVGVLTLCKLF